MPMISPGGSRFVWPRSRRAWGLYALVWVTYTFGYVALFWIRDGGPSWPSISGALRIMVPAALWGVAVLVVASRIDLLAGRSMRTVAPHVLGAVLYPVLWVGTVSGVAALMRGSSTGTWRWRLPPEHVLHWHFLSGVLIYITLAAVSYGLEYSMRSDRSRQRAEWQLLRAQLNPHFLFNTLHTLIALSRTDARTAERALDSFSRVLRFSLNVTRYEREWVSLGEEWGFARDYLQLEELRFGERLRWEADLSRDALECAIPPVSLQPLLENALRFAVESRLEGARLTIGAKVEDGTLSLRVADDGPGCVASEAEASPGVGLRSIRARLETLTPGVGRLQIDTAPGRGFAATIALPAMEAEQHAASVHA